MLVWPFILILVGLSVVEREVGKCGPQSRRANALPATREKDKIDGECCLNVIGREVVREQREKRFGVTVIGFESTAPASVKEQWCLNESDDQYGRCDLRDSGLEQRLLSKTGIGRSSCGNF